MESHVEKVIKTVWSEVLEKPTDELRKDDNFFSVGGTSLTAVILSRKLGIELCTEVSVQDVFQYQTISDFKVRRVKYQGMDAPTPLSGPPDCICETKLSYS